MESYKYLNLVEMEELKSSADQIEQTKVILDNMDGNMEASLKKFKEEVIQSLKEETGTYQRYWLNQYNREMVNKNCNNKKLNYLTFDNHNLINLRMVNDNELPTVPSMKKQTKKEKKKTSLPKSKYTCLVY